MARELLTIPEEHLRDVVHVIQAGLNEVEVDQEVYEALTEWCEGMKGYLERLKNG